MKKNQGPAHKFIIGYREQDGKHLLNFIPSIENEGYPPKEIEITKEQWDALQYHFAKALDDRKNVTQLAYVV